MKKYEEKKVINQLSSVCQFDGTAMIFGPKPNALIGIKRLGKIDFLRNYCKWIWSKSHFNN